MSDPLQGGFLKREMLLQVGICEVIAIPLELFYVKLAHEVGSTYPGASDKSGERGYPRF